MTPAAFLGYVSLTISQPRVMARQLLALQMPREALWMSFGLVIVLNTLVFSLSILGSPLSGMMAPILTSPVTFALMLAVSVGLVIVAVTYSGRAVGGSARMDQIAILVIWLQGLRVLVQLAVTLLTLVSAFFAGIVVMAASILGIWIFVNFIDEAHGLGSMLKSLVTLLLAVVGMTLGLSMLFSLLGFSAAGLPGYV